MDEITIGSGIVGAKTLYEALHGEGTWEPLTLQVQMDWARAFSRGAAAARLCTFTEGPV